MFTLLKHYLLGPIWEAAENLPRALCSLSPLCSSCHRCFLGWAGAGAFWAEAQEGWDFLFTVDCTFRHNSSGFGCAQCSCASFLDKQVGESCSSGTHLFRGQSRAHGDASEPRLLPDHVWGEGGRLQGSWSQTPYGEKTLSLHLFLFIRVMFTGVVF